MIKFNINEKVKVKLNEVGMQILEDDHYSRHMKTFVPPVVDEDGYCSFQMWELMGTFGGVMRHPTFNPPFHSSILISRPETKLVKTLVDIRVVLALQQDRGCLGTIYPPHPADCPPYSVADAMVDAITKVLGDE